MFDRWLPRLTPSARALLAAERSRREDEALKARALERAEATLEGERWSGILPRLAAEHPKHLGRSRGARSALLIAAALACAGLAVASAGLVLHGSSAATSVAPLRVVPAPPSRPAVRSRPEHAPDAHVVEEPAPPLPVSSAAARARPTGARQYAIELALLEPARSSVARGDYGAALGAIGKHQHDYPSGQLAEEREALRVRALWGLGQKPAAEAAAASFRRRYPRSVLLSWMKDTPAP